MSAMSMNVVIHRAIRRDLRRFVDALERFPIGDGPRARDLLLAWRQFEDQLITHHTGEHAIAWPALESVGVSPDLLAVMDTEHDAMAGALRDASAAMQALSVEPATDQAAGALDAVRRLETVTLAHLEHEESELEPVYQAKQGTPEMKAMGRAFGKQGPARGGRFIAWVSDGAGPQELAAMRSEIPGPVVTIVGGVFGRGYRKQIAPVWTR